ncbi:hypothetical protein D9M72_299310 [compost metagenome]
MGSVTSAGTLLDLPLYLAVSLPVGMRGSSCPAAFAAALCPSSTTALSKWMLMLSIQGCFFGSVRVSLAASKAMVSGPLLR